MTRFMVLYRSAVSAKDQMASATPEQARAGMEAWMAWAAKAGDAVVDLGAPLEPAAHAGPGSTAEGAAQVTGFSILQAESAGELTALLNEHPHLHMPGGSIDALEFIPMPPVPASDTRDELIARGHRRGSDLAVTLPDPRSRDHLANTGRSPAASRITAGQDIYGSGL